MKKFKALVDPLREVNGLIAKTKKDPTSENITILEDRLRHLKATIEGVLP